MLSLIIGYVHKPFKSHFDRKFLCIFSLGVLFFVFFSLYKVSKDFILGEKLRSG